MTTTCGRLPFKSPNFWLVLLIAVLLILTGCSSVSQVEPARELTVTEEPRPSLAPPAPIVTQTVTFQVLTRKTLPEDEFVFYAVTPEQYENMARNQKEIERWIAQAADQIRYYQKEADDELGRE